jgi:3'-phosphoadenosine 5'-phosphosulfate sulfotransferase (PAPS reductase)/FAD synthetase
MTKDITSAINIIEEALTKCVNPYIAFSGGKDSTVLLHLVRKVSPDIKVVFHDTGVEARQTYDYIKTMPEIIITKPNTTFYEVVKKYGWPGFKAQHHDGNKCCVYLKEKPAKELNKKMGFDLTFLGLTIHESRNRFLLLKSRGWLYRKKDGMWKCYPIWDWTEKDVWDYIKENNIPYNKGYDCGWRRCGCMPCTAHFKWQERLAKENPKMLKMILRQRYGQRQCGDYYGL